MPPNYEYQYLQATTTNNNIRYIDRPLPIFWTGSRVYTNRTLQNNSGLLSRVSSISPIKPSEACHAKPQLEKVESDSNSSFTNSLLYSLIFVGSYFSSQPMPSSTFSSTYCSWIGIQRTTILERMQNANPGGLGRSLYDRKNYYMPWSEV